MSYIRQVFYSFSTFPASFNPSLPRHVLVGATSFGVSTCEGPYPAMFTRSACGQKQILLISCFLFCNCNKSLFPFEQFIKTTFRITAYLYSSIHFIATLTLSDNEIKQKQSTSSIKSGSLPTSRSSTQRWCPRPWST